MHQREFSYVRSDNKSESDEDELEGFKREESEESYYAPYIETESEDKANPGEGANGTNSSERNTVQSKVKGTSGTIDTKSALVQKNDQCRTALLRRMSLFHVHQKLI